MNLTRAGSKLGVWLVVVAAGLVLSSAARADFVKGLSLRAGIWTPSTSQSRDGVDFGAFSLGLEYELPFVPSLLNGEGWTTTLSVDFHYSQRKVAVVRYVPVSINQVYSFSEQNGKVPYAGFSITAATMGATDGTGHPTVTRWGGGLILGVKLNDKLKVETRYEWIEVHGASWNVDGFRTYIGYKF